MIIEHSINTPSECLRRKQPLSRALESSTAIQTATPSLVPSRQHERHNGARQGKTKRVHRVAPAPQIHQQAAYTLKHLTRLASAQITARRPVLGDNAATTAQQPIQSASGHD